MSIPGSPTTCAYRPDRAHRVVPPLPARSERGIAQSRALGDRGRTIAFHPPPRRAERLLRRHSDGPGFRPVLGAGRLASSSQSERALERTRARKAGVRRHAVRTDHDALLLAGIAECRYPLTQQRGQRCGCSIQAPVSSVKASRSESSPAESALTACVRACESLGCVPRAKTACAWDTAW